MAEDGIISDTASKLQNGLHNGTVAVETSGVHVAASGVEALAKTPGALLPAFYVGAAVTAGVTQWDYVQERDNIRKQYDMELSAQTGKPYNEVTNKDLDLIGQKNVVIGDALKRAKWKRNVGFVVGTLAMGAALAAAAIALPLVMTALGTIGGGTAIASGLTGAGGIFAALGNGSIASAALGVAKIVGVGLASVPAFLATEKVANTVVDATFGMKEPSLRKVMQSPSLQSGLSVSSQVKFLEHLQKKVHQQKPETFISQEQVFTTILAAQPQMAQKIKDTYGNNFSSLSADRRLAVLTDANQSINLEQITEDLNHRQIRAQELAFIVQGQSSGVPRRETTRLTTMEKAHAHIEQELAEAKTVIKNLKTHMKATDTKLGKLTGATLAMSQSEPPQAATPAFIQDEMGPATKRLLAERKAAGLRQGSAVA